MEHPRGFVTQYKYRDHPFDDTLQPAPRTLERLESLALKEAHMTKQGEVAVRYKRMVRHWINEQQTLVEESLHNGSHVRSLLRGASLATLHTEGRGLLSAVVAESISSRGNDQRRKRRNQKDPILTQTLGEASIIGSKSLNLNENGKKDLIQEDPIGIVTNVTGSNPLTADSVSAYASNHQELHPTGPRPTWKAADYVPRLFSDRESGAAPYRYVIHPEMRIPPPRRDFEPKVLHRLPDNEKDRDFIKHVGGKKGVFYPQADLHVMPELPRSISAGIKFQTKFFQRDPPNPTGPSSVKAVAHTTGPVTRTGTAATVGMTNLKSGQGSLYPRLATTTQGWKQLNKHTRNPEEISAMPAYGAPENEPLMLDGNRKIPRSVSAAKLRLNS